MTDEKARTGSPVSAASAGSTDGAQDGETVGRGASGDGVRARGPKPYYEQDGVTIYHGDCFEIAPQLGSFDLLLSDVPYGINYVHGGGGRAVSNNPNAVYRRNVVPVVGDAEPFDPSPWLAYGAVMVWGANHFAHRLPPGGSWHGWDKTRGGQGPDDSFSDIEFVWINRPGASKILHYLWKGVCQDGEKGERRYHPTQKPIAVMRWCLGFWPEARTVLDPFMGAGSTLIAARQLGRRAVGIEIEERYCEIAATRLLQGDLFADTSAGGAHHQHAA